MLSLLQPLLEDRVDLVLGSRLLFRSGQAMLPYQGFGNVLTAFLMRWLYGQPITDLSPYRAIRTELLLALSMHEMTFGYPTEMLVKAVKHKARLLEVPVKYLPRQAGKSKVSGALKGTILATFFILMTTFRYTWGGSR